MNGRNSWRLSPSRRARRARCWRSRPASPRPSNSLSNSRPSSIALVMSLTWNSSRQSSRVVVEHRLRHRRDRIGILRLALGRCAEFGDRLMHLVHELVEMHAAASPRSAPPRRTGPSAWSCRARPRRRGRRRAPASACAAAEQPRGRCGGQLRGDAVEDRAPPALQRIGVSAPSGRGLRACRLTGLAAEPLPRACRPLADHRDALAARQGADEAVAAEGSAPRSCRRSRRTAAPGCRRAAS